MATSSTSPALSAFAHPNGTTALLFYSQPENTLALQIRSATTNEESETDTMLSTYENTDLQAKGDINSPTSLAALYLDVADTPLIGVYGVIKVPKVPKCPSDSTADSGRLCLLSPAFMPLENTSESVTVNMTSGRLAGVQDPGGAGWLYFRSTESADKISRMDIKTRSTVVTNATNPSENTFLAAYYDTVKKERHLLYQKNYSDETSRIFDLNDNDNSSTPDEVNGVKYAHFPAGMAAVWVKDKAYLYYVAKLPSKSEYQLYRAVKDTTGEWAKSEYCNTKSDLLNTTQLTATALKGKNYIAYFNDKSVMETFEDPQS